MSIQKLKSVTMTVSLYLSSLKRCVRSRSSVCVPTQKMRMIGEEVAWDRRKRQRASPMGLNVLLLAIHILLKREENEPSEFKCGSYEILDWPLWNTRVHNVNILVVARVVYQKGPVVRRASKLVHHCRHRGHSSYQRYHSLKDVGNIGCWNIEHTIPWLRTMIKDVVQSIGRIPGKLV